MKLSFACFMLIIIIFNSDSLRYDEWTSTELRLAKDYIRQVVLDKTLKYPFNDSQTHSRDFRRFMDGHYSRPNHQVLAGIILENYSKYKFGKPKLIRECPHNRQVFIH